MTSSTDSLRAAHSAVLRTVNSASHDELGIHSKNTDKEKRLGTLAAEFEAMIVSTLVAQAFPKLNTAGPLSDGPGSDIPRTLMVDTLSKTLVGKRGGFGLAHAIERSLIALQEESQP